MRIAIIIGANNIGINVAKTLMDKYETVIVDSNDEACSRAFKALKSSALVYRGDPGSEDVLSEVGIDKAELFLALSDDDELNHRACSIAVGKGVPIIIARVNNKSNEDLFKELNITSIINVEDLVINTIESMLTRKVAKSMFTDPLTNLSFVIIRINENSQIIGKQISYVINNYEVAVPYVITSGRIIKPGDDYVIEGNDELVIVGPSASINKLISELLTE